jgi:ferredoxin
VIDVQKSIRCSNMRAKHLAVVTVTRRTFLRSIPGVVRGAVKRISGVSGMLLTRMAMDTQWVIELNTDRCLAYGGADCQLCYVRCPAQDRAMMIVDGRPEVVSEDCDACGRCVTACAMVNDVPALQRVHQQTVTM